jgi:thiosulfate/3-mercaptopyruvate sulfurtransferase
MLLIDPAGLADSLGSTAPPVVLDIRYRLGDSGYGAAGYQAGHIPGAVFVDLDRDLAAPPGSGPGGSGGRHPLPSAESFSEAMRAVGVRDDVPVVVYDDGESVPAARAWWNLRYFGHPAVRVLDGGYRAWQAAGLPVTLAAPPVAPGDFTARPGHMPVVDAAGAAALARDGVLIDVRAAERYRGETEPIDPVAGHIPGALNVPIADTGTQDGTFKDPAALAALFATLAAGGTPAVGAYCGSGVSAARGVLALALAGITAALYTGSWSDWIQDPTRPIAP